MATVVVDTIGALRAHLDAQSNLRQKRIGFVPTMGFLHEGHATLVRRARAECDVVVASIFVNPTQFGPNEDFATYPRNLVQDVALLERDGADVVFAPDARTVYPDGFSTSIKAGSVAATLEGEYRPGHFDGVATVVAKLFNIVQPHVAYFGEKDWQQLQVVKQMVRDLDMPVEITGVPIVREADGLAMSSRNVRLSADERAQALCLYRALTAVRTAFAVGERSALALEQLMLRELEAESAASVDYAVVRDARTLQPITTATPESRALIAARVGNVRLIDNMSLS